MARWEYTLKFGPALKDAIRDENPESILDALVACFTEINKAMPDYYDSDDLEEDLMDISDLHDSLENYDEYGMTYDDVVENIDGMLYNFYDMCDNLNIWVGI